MFSFSLSPEQTRLKDLSPTSLQPTSNELHPDTIKHREAPVNICLHTSLDDENCAIEQAGIAGSKQDRRLKRNVQADSGECDQEKHAAPIRPCRKKESLTSNQKLDGFSVTPMSEVISVQMKMKDATCEIPIESTTSPTRLHTIPPLETKEIKCITSKSKKEIKHDEHTSSLSIIKKRLLPKQVRKAGRSNSDKETAAQDLNVSNKEFVKPIQFNNTALGDMKEPKQPVSNTSIDASSISSKVAEDILGGGQIEPAKQKTNPVPRPRVRKSLRESFTDNCTSTETASQTSHCDKVQTTEEDVLLSVLSTSDQLSVVEQIKPLPNLQTKFSASMAGFGEKPRHTSAPCMENSASLHLRVTPEGGSVPTHGEDVQLEMEVLEAMQEVFTLEDTSQVQDQTFQGLALINKQSVTNKLENNDIRNVLERDVERFGTITVPSCQDEWLHVEPKKDIEEMKICPSNEVKDEEIDFGFVSINVAADCSENQR